MSNENMIETSLKKRPRKPITEENKPGKYDSRNKLNDLTGKEWLLLSKSFWESEPIKEDKGAYKHPAPFLIKDIEKLISLFTKKNMTVLDPFVGCGTTIIAANNLGRKAIGIDLNEKYYELSLERFKGLSIPKGVYEYIVADANTALTNIKQVDYIVTSPPYHNILKNTSKGIRHYNGKDYRIGARDGVEYYSDEINDLGNFEKYEDFIQSLKSVMSKCFSVLKEGKYLSIIISDFTVNKKEVCVQADVVNMMIALGFQFCGTTVLLQKVKPLFPFGYPYSYKINHHHQSIITFRKFLLPVA